MQQKAGGFHNYKFSKTINQVTITLYSPASSSGRKAHPELNVDW